MNKEELLNAISQIDFGTNKILEYNNNKISVTKTILQYETKKYFINIKCTMLLGMIYVNEQLHSTFYNQNILDLNEELTEKTNEICLLSNRLNTK